MASKISVALRDEQLREIHALVATGEAANASAFVRHAVDVALSDAAGWSETLADALRQTGGPLTRKERAWADRILQPRPRSRKRKTALSGWV